MGRVIPMSEKNRLVLLVVRDQKSVVEVARTGRVSKTALSKWVRQFRAEGQITDLRGKRSAQLPAVSLPHLPGRSKEHQIIKEQELRLGRLRRNLAALVVEAIETGSLDLVGE